MSPRAQQAQRYLDVLLELEAHAAPSERSYYEAVRRKHERVLANETAVTGESTHADESPAALAEYLDAGYQGLHTLQYDLARVDLDRHWKTWLEEQVTLYQAEIDEIERQMRAQGHPYTPPTPDAAAIAREMQEEQCQQELMGLKTLYELKLAWGERQDALDRVQPELDELKRQIELLESPS